MPTESPAMCHLSVLFSSAEAGLWVQSPWPPIQADHDHEQETCGGSGGPSQPRFLNAMPPVEQRSPPQHAFVLILKTGRRVTMKSKATFTGKQGSPPSSGVQTHRIFLCCSSLREMFSTCWLTGIPRNQVIFQPTWEWGSHPPSIQSHKLQEIPRCPLSCSPQIQLGGSSPQ